MRGGSEQWREGNEKKMRGGNGKSGRETTKCVEKEEKRGSAGER